MEPSPKALPHFLVQSKRVAMKFEKDKPDWKEGWKKKHGIIVGPKSKEENVLRFVSCVECH